jgi:Holliday junction resolvase RusA-like endonuclease
MRTEIAAITVPQVPPSVNNYARHTRFGKHYVSTAAINFKGLIAQFSRRQRIRGDAYKCEIWVFLGHKMRGDVDNFAKVTIDGLVEAEVIDTDAKIVNLHLYKRRDNAKPRTEIVVEIVEA